MSSHSASLILSKFSRPHLAGAGLIHFLGENAGVPPLPPDFRFDRYHPIFTLKVTTVISPTDPGSCYAILDDLRSHLAVGKIPISFHLGSDHIIQFLAKNDLYSSPIIVTDKGGSTATLTAQFNHDNWRLTSTPVTVELKLAGRAFEARELLSNIIFKISLEFVHL